MEAALGTGLISEDGHHMAPAPGGRENGEGGGAEGGGGRDRWKYKGRQKMYYHHMALILNELFH